MMRWVLYAAADLLVSMFVRAFCWLLPVFAVWRVGKSDNDNYRREELRLPRWLYWFGTDDNSLFGDAGHVSRWRGKSRYLQMVTWLFRNPAYVFAETVLGAEIKAGMRVTLVGNPFIKNRDNGVAGRYVCHCGPSWNRKVVKDIGVWFGVRRCFMAETGWKLQDVAKSASQIFSTGRIVKPHRVALAFSVRLTRFNPQ